MDQGQKMMNQENFTRQQIKERTDELHRLRMENKRCELECYMYQCIAGNLTLDTSNLPDAEEMNWVINNALRDIQSKQDALMAKFRRPKL